MKNVKRAERKIEHSNGQKLGRAVTTVREDNLIRQTTTMLTGQSRIKD